MTDSKGTALVTGASAGIGTVYADRLARRGYDLILVARDRARLATLARTLGEETGRRIEVLPADLADRMQLAEVEHRLASDPAITLFVNNAGISLNGTFLDVEADAVERLIAVNVTAPTLLARAAARAFAGRKAGGVITLSSVLALAPEMSDPAYSATKAFVLNLTQGMVRILDGTGVRVQAVLPGATRTEIWERSGKDVNSFPPDWVMEAGDLVDAALTGYDRGEVVTIPPLADDADFRVMQDARLRLAPNLSRRDVAPRYRTVA